MTIQRWIHQAVRRLHKSRSSSPQLDAELLLSFALKKPRTYLLTHPETTLQTRPLKTLNTLLERRLGGEPMAYIVGKKEFYGRDFIVTPGVLIPRPETETIIDILKAFSQRLSLKDEMLVDVGTGSGVLAVTAKLELAGLEVIATDISTHALSVAKKNALLHKTKVRFMQADLLDSPDVLQLLLNRQNRLTVVANLPYVDSAWRISPEVHQFEPGIALFAAQHGLKLIENLLIQTATVLQPGELLVLEADPRQHAKITSFAKTHGFTLDQIQDYILAFKAGIGRA